MRVNRKGLARISGYFDKQYFAESGRVAANGHNLPFRDIHLCGRFTGQNGHSGTRSADTRQ